jgi:hypothetical protein
VSADAKKPPLAARIAMDVMGAVGIAATLLGLIALRHWLTHHGG